jgi:hypothetical protein
MLCNALHHKCHPVEAPTLRILDLKCVLNEETLPVALWKPITISLHKPHRISGGWRETIRARSHLGELKKRQVCPQDHEAE